GWIPHPKMLLYRAYALIGRLFEKNNARPMEKIINEHRLFLYVQWRNVYLKKQLSTVKCREIILKANNIYKELKAIFVEWPIWFMLGTQDIKLRYRFSSIGPFWITINMAITVYSMSFLYSHLFKVKLEDYLPYLTSGIICWSFLSNLFIEGSNAFI
ncbi:ABC transporter permease, partial [Legionella anisa]